jgi:hypothetical protein
MSDTNIPFANQIFRPTTGSLITPFVPVSVPTSFPIGTPLDGLYRPATATPTGFQNPCIGLAAATGTPDVPVPIVTSGIFQLTVAQLAAVLDSSIYTASGLTNPAILAEQIPEFLGQNLYVSQGNPLTSLPPPPVSGVLAFQDFTITNPYFQSLILQVGTLVALSQPSSYTPDDVVGVVINVQNQTPQNPSTLFDYGSFVDETLICQPVYVTSSGPSAGPNFALAQGNEEATANVAGLALSPQPAGSLYGGIVTQGLFGATIAQWDAVTGASMGGLVPGAVYYLSTSTPGMLTTVAPDSDFSTYVGIALSTTAMFVRPGVPTVA